MSKRGNESFEIRNKRSELRQVEGRCAEISAGSVMAAEPSAGREICGSSKGSSLQGSVVMALSARVFRAAGIQKAVGVWP